MRFKSFSFPKDINILINVFRRIIVCRLKVRKYGYNRLLEGLRRNRQGNKADRDFLDRFNKYYKACNFFLLRILRDPNPCMIRSLVLYDLCLRNNIRAVLKTGVSKSSGNLIGHSWLELEGMPLNEDRKFLERFTVIYEV